MSVVKSLKDLIHHPKVPSAIFRAYFNWKQKRERQQLFSILSQEGNLLDELQDSDRRHWAFRISDVKQCLDNQYIPRNNNAGQIIDGNLIMHNGIQIDPLSYYSFPMLRMLKENRGVHEPQEEKVFQEVLESFNNIEHQPKYMLELGAYWSFYSLWMKKLFPNANCYMVEPRRMNLFHGQNNFNLNRLKGTFIHSGISSHKDKKSNLSSVDEICKQQGIPYIDILHADIQGHELDMLKGSKRMLDENRIGYAFISTHSEELHEACFQFLKEKYDFQTVANASPKQSFSWDGVLVMKAKSYPGVGVVDIDLKEELI